MCHTQHGLLLCSCRYLEQYERLEASGSPFDPSTYVPPPPAPHKMHSPRPLPVFNNFVSSPSSPHVPSHHSPLPNLVHLTPTQLQQLQLLLQAPTSSATVQSFDTTRYDWIVRSLQCGLPNEVDFALNTLLMMSYDEHMITPLPAVSGPLIVCPQ